VHKVGVLVGGEVNATQTDEAVLILGADGTYRHASPRALELLGLSLDELKALPPGALSTTPADERQALQKEWERSGARAALGETTVAVPGGRTFRARFALAVQPDGTYRATITPVAGPVTGPTRLYAVGEVLEAWRAEERKLEALEPGTPEWQEVKARAEGLRRSYARHFERQRGQALD
jgi:PAS domain-containing protein